MTVIIAQYTDGRPPEWDQMMSRIDGDLATTILAAIDDFSQPINRLDAVLRTVDDDETRRRLLRRLGDLMGLLDGEIGREARGALLQKD